MFPCLCHTIVIITSLLQDFLKSDPSSSEFADVRAVILDPSCSGSGTATHTLAAMSSAPHTALEDARVGEVACGDCTAAEADNVTTNEQHHNAAFPGLTSDTSDRVKALSNFQATILKHALRFPSLQRLVYSTCSVYREENEDVVAEVLPVAHKSGFVLKTALPQWPRRGLEGTFEWAAHLARVHPDLDETDGFFLAMFERK